jgi:hypothetical protein
MLLIFGLLLRFLQLRVFPEFQWEAWFPLLPAPMPIVIFSRYNFFHIHFTSRNVEETESLPIMHGKNRACAPELFLNEARKQCLCERTKNTDEHIFCSEVNCAIIISMCMSLTCLFSFPVTAKKIIVKKYIHFTDTVIFTPFTSTCLYIYERRLLRLGLFTLKNNYYLVWKRMLQNF